MKKIILIIILNLFCYSSFSISDEIDVNYVKWNVEFESLNTKKKLVFCYPVLERVKDFHLYMYLFKKKNETSSDKIKEIKKKSITEYIVASFRQHVIIKNLVLKLDNLPKDEILTLEFRENLIKDESLMSLSDTYIGKEYMKIIKTQIPYKCFKTYDDFFGVNSASKFSQKELDAIQDYSIEEFKNREDSIIKKMTN
tara:strand:+ start:230 stop:820 length:591 start_codon:yes stop_codon:yes gene_type:complete